MEEIILDVIFHLLSSATRDSDGAFPSAADPTKGPDSGPRQVRPVAVEIISCREGLAIRVQDVGQRYCSCCRMPFPGFSILPHICLSMGGVLALYRQDMLPSRHIGELADNVQAPVVGARSHWPSRSERARHTHFRHQLMYSQKGVIHVSTPAGSWILPPTRSIWISGGTPHALLVKRPVELINLWVHRDAPGAPNWTGCNVVSVSPLIRELLNVCSKQPWDYPPASRSSRLAQVLLEQLEVHEQAPLELPELSDPRAARVAAMLRADPADRRSLAELSSAAGASHRTIERLFASEARMSFARWRVRNRMTTALEHLAYGDSVSNVAYVVGYETPSSFIAAFRASFGTTPTAYFQDMHDWRASKE